MVWLRFPIFNKTLSLSMMKFITNLYFSMVSNEFCWCTMCWNNITENIDYILFFSITKISVTIGSVYAKLCATLHLLLIAGISEYTVSIATGLFLT